jgi:hypothetical protein
MRSRISELARSGVLHSFALFALFSSSSAAPRTQAPPDEAKAHGLTPKAFEARPHDYFPSMDWVVEAPGGARLWPDALLDKAPQANAAESVAGAPELIDSEVMGRNTWMLWCGGNERFWDWLATDSYGFMDLLKLLDSKKRGKRWETAGMVNEPDMVQASSPDEFGLWLDRPVGPQVEWEKDKEFVLRYGRSSGVIGLRLFLNPEFEAHRDEWDAERYYDEKDTAYWQSPDLVRPYRVGMSCAFCHASAHPLNPPLDPEAPRWENLSASIGSQYLRMRAVFGNLLTPDNFIYHVLDSQPPGTIDTSLIASDMINNTNTMNAIFGVPQRVRRSLDNPFERLSGASASLPILGDFTVGEREVKETGPYLNPRPVPRVLFDGADSIGVYGALARVYLNIGTYSEQWLRLHNPLLGGVPQEPFTIRDCQQNSVYWQATQARVTFLRDYFLRITPTMPLRKAALTSAERERGLGAIDATRLAQGRVVFARNCIVCHSSLQPESVLDGLDLDRDGTEDLPFLDAADLAAAKAFQGHHAPIASRRKARQEQWSTRGELWDHDPGQWLTDGEYVAWATAVVEEPWFWRHNFLSTDFRVPVNYVQTNSARALATNAMAGNVWADFSSDSFKALPSVGAIPYFDPYLPTADGKFGAESTFTPRHHVAAGVPEGGGGPGFYRPATLMSVWATAPYLHNNSLGLFNNDPSVGGRLSAFEDGIAKLLWPEKRLESSSYNDATPERLRADHGLIWRTPCETRLRLPGQQIATAFGRLPSLIAGMMKDPPAILAWLVEYPWVPSVALLVAALLLLRRFADDERGRRRRRWGVALIVLALPIGVVLFFVSGRLGDLSIGPIPKGTPVNLLVNLNLEDRESAFEALKTTVGALTEIKAKHLEGAEADAVLRTKVAPALMAASKCPDLVMDRGHDFPWFKGMSDEDKRCLIELLKTL